MDILLVATAWGTNHGGANAFNYRLCRALKDEQHNITCYVKDVSVPDYEDAQKHGIILSGHKRDSANKWSEEDLGSVDTTKLENFDAVVIHDLISAAFLDLLPKDKRRASIISFIHTWYSKTDYFNRVSDDEIEKRTQLQLDLISNSDLVFTSGTWVLSAILTRRPELRTSNKIYPFTPGKLELPSVRLSEADSILSFGRLSLRAGDNKGAFSVINAYNELARIRNQGHATQPPLPRLILLGAASTADDDQTALTFENQLKEDLARIDSRAQLILLAFDHYYAFEESRTYTYLKHAKLVVTPSRAETFGLTSLEAASLGIPLIASENSGFHDELKTLVPNLPEKSIEWLKPYHFETLVQSLCEIFRRILDDYDNYKKGSLVLADEIQGVWPTWQESAHNMITILSRFSLEASGKPDDSYNESLSSDNKSHQVQSPFAVLGEMRSTTPKAEQEVSTNTDTFQHEMPMLDGPTLSQSMPPLFDLARVCYQDNMLDNEPLRESLVFELTDKYCTPLQAELLMRLNESFPGDYQDFLLCGGTSSGKTTAAELLIGLSNNSDLAAARIIYLAPTRALAQERWRAWQERYSTINTGRRGDNVIISTGEDHSGDRALARGEFLIACLVTEKANVMLSTSPSLLQKLNMIIVDEIHMIDDIQRGPVIETLLAKARQEKQRRQRTSGYRIPFRLVGITTEAAATSDFEKYLTNKAAYFDVMGKPPIRATQVGRPVPVRHIIVIPEQTHDKFYREVEVDTFRIDAPLQISSDRLRSISHQLAYSQRNPDARNSEGASNSSDTRKRQYVEFILAWLLGNRHGKRLLAFIGSKASQVEIAEQLQSAIRRHHLLNERKTVPGAIDSIYSQIDSGDSPIDSPTLVRTVNRGIFIHNGDIHKGLRVAIETYLQVPLLSNAASEVVLATTTLSYGVNLAIDDVALLEVEFPSAERIQSAASNPRTLLTHCQFANMCGRAGRLNQNRAIASVYVWAVTENNILTPKGVVDLFYRKEGAIRSQVVHAEDDKKLAEMDRSHQRDQAPTKFSYPLVRTVLDGLRFMGGAPGQAGVTRRSDATPQEIEDDFVLNIFSAHSNESNNVPVDRLLEFFQMTIKAQSAIDLELIEPVNQGYRITPLGSSIIDTGTEITTLAPLKLSLERLLTRLNESGLGNSAPVECLLLPILVQGEAHRQYVFNMPEFRTEVAAVDNRAELLKWILTNFGYLGFTETVLDVITEFLKESDNRPHHASPKGGAASWLVHDGCLRLFAGLLLWVTGHSISQINDILKGIGRITGKQAPVSVNIASFAELVSWKLLFMSDLMRFGARAPKTRVLITNTRVLTTRLRLGCRAEALPFLVSIGTERSSITRKQAHELVAAGATQKGICSGDFDLDEFSSSLRGRIKTQVRRFIKHSFSMLRNEFVFETPSEGVGGISKDFWDSAYSAICSLIEGNSSAVKWPEGVGDGVCVVEAESGVSGSEAPTLHFRYHYNSLLIVGRRFVWEDDKRTEKETIKIQVKISVSPLPIVDIGLRDHIMVTVDFPWLVDALTSASPRTRMSPAAFGILLTLIARGFLRDSISSLEAICAGGGAINCETLMDIIYSELLLNQLPDPLFDTWASYLDASI